MSADGNIFSGLKVLHRLVRWTDVLVTNYPPKVSHALGLTAGRSIEALEARRDDELLALLAVRSRG